MANTPSFLVRNKYWCLVAGLIAFYALTNVFFYQYYYELDTWAYSASIRELAKNPSNPSNPHLLSPAPAMWFSPYLFFWAMFQRIAGIDVFKVMGLAGVVNVFILSLGVYFFVREYFSSDDLLPFLVLVTMLFFWGKGWDFSGCFDFDWLRYSSFYPSIFCLGLSMICFFLALRFVECGRVHCIIGIALINSVILVTHVFTATFCFLGIALLSFRGEKMAPGRRIALLASIPVAFASALFWPYYSIYRAIALTSEVGVPFAPELQMDVASRLGPMILGVPVALYYLIKRKHVFLVLWLSICALMYLSACLINNSIGSRYVFFGAVLLSIFISLMARDSYRRLIVSRTTLPRLLAYSYIAILAMCVTYQCAKIGFKYAGYRSLEGILKGEPVAQGSVGKAFLGKFDFLRSYVRDGDVVLSDPETTWVVPSFAGRSVSMWRHYNPFVIDIWERFIDVREFFETEPGDIGYRREILRKYGVKYLLINSGHVSPELSADLKKLGRIVYDCDGMTLVDAT